MPRLAAVLAVLLVAALAFSGCRCVLPGDMGLPFAETTDSNLLKVVEPDGGAYTAGDTVDIAWESTLGPPRLDIHLYESGKLVTVISRAVEDTTHYAWNSPSDLPASDQYQIAVLGYHPQQGEGELLLTAFCEQFSIVRPQ
jgi:hypothetical protein